MDTILKSDSDENIYFDSTKGELPYLATTAGTFLYTLPTTYYRIKDIVVRESNYKSINPYFSANEHDNVKSPIEIAGKRYRVVSTVKNQPYGSGTCTVMFRQDPQTTSTTYQIYGYIPVNKISSVSSTLNVPEEFHLSVIVPALQLMIDGLENGKFTENLAYIEQSLLSKIVQKKLYNSEIGNYSAPMDI
jgi:hypothetical protein